MNQHEDSLGFGGPISVFYSYSRKDEELRNELDKHLSVLKRQGLIAGWHDRDIDPGTDWDQAIKKQLNKARIVLLLVSADFLASDYCWDTEMTTALKRHEEDQARVIPVILRPVVWEKTEFRKLNALPTDAKPVTIWENRDEAFADIAQGIARAAAQFNQRLARSHENMVRIDSGGFFMGTDSSEIDDLIEWAKGQYPNQTPERAWFENETPRQQIQLDDFFIDKCPVTNEQYRRFVDDTGYPEPIGFKENQYTWEYGFKPWEHDGFSRDDQPVVCVSWYDALAYAWWSGNRLPTEAEWEKAARGGLKSCRYPWGDERPNEDRCNYLVRNRDYLAVNEHLDHEYTTRCQKYPQYGYGLHEMAGNIWEWCADVFDARYYGSDKRPSKNPCNGFIPNLSGFKDLRDFLVTFKQTRVTRGGSWIGEEGSLRVARRNHFPAASANNLTGFRCARSGK